MQGTSAIGGLISGIDTKTIVEQFIAISRRRVNLVVKNQEKHDSKLAAFQSLKTMLSDFHSKANTLRDIKTFNSFKTSLSTDSTTFNANDLLSVTTTSDASKGSHTIAFTSSSQLAQARRLSSGSFSSSTTALGLSGEFTINGKAIAVSSTDTLADIASIINRANSGLNATGVTASVITISDTDKRLILTSDHTGKDKFNILDASSVNILQSLGFTNGSTTIKNATSNGASSDEFSSSTAAVGSLLGLSDAQSSTTVGIAGTNVSIDLSTDSLTEIAAAIDAVNGVSASVTSTTTDGNTTYKLVISGTTSFNDSNNILETLGILKGLQNSVAQVHTASVSNTETSTGTGTFITSSTTFSAINTDGDDNNVTNNDTITFSGTNHNGSAVSGTYQITDRTADTIGNLLTQIETTFGLEAGSATVNANGQIVITNSTPGDSQLSISIITNNEGGGTLDFGTVSVTTRGYDMEITAGQDARVNINGVNVTRSSNVIEDVISGVTIDLKRVEAGKTVNLTISRNTDNIKSHITNFTTAYNRIIEFINQQFTYNENTEESGILAGESTLSTIKRILQSTITNTIPLLPPGSNTLSLIGIISDRDGKLSVEEDVFLSKINSDFDTVKRMFIAEGATTNSEIRYVNHTKNTVPGDYEVVITTVAARAAATGSEVLTNGIGMGNTETLTITDTGTNRIATINLNGDGGENGSSIDTIIQAINSELNTEYTQALIGDVENTAGGIAITDNTLFSGIDGTSLNDGDVISFSGTTRSGRVVSGSFAINDVNTDTVRDFLSAIEDAYSNNVTATINDGKIVLTDNITGDSQLSITITGPSGSGLDFGTILETNPDGVKGRFAMEITASKDEDDRLVLTHKSYGSRYGFTTTETNNLLGTSGTHTGVDVAGTIHGEAATGTGRLLVGDAPHDSSSATSVEGLTIEVNSTTTGSKGQIKLTKGIGEIMYDNLDSIIDQFDGLLTIRMDGLQKSIENMQKSIDAMEERLSMEASRLYNQFVQLELNLSKLQSQGEFMEQQLMSLSISPARK
ncbi:MAG: flagellar filament capping protein FliD [Candidatus Loosdrechtia sp.]|uniref:flagellar filament capping protein FliD n=1 Tax=Candidatus Loosdrechtia sp. TaxID=3101272 RepID=UPI003A5EB22B|nr:MAG: flagellar filament capping protein FliD [Candidatus Jettenia sp. AMX2]